MFPGEELIPRLQELFRQMDEAYVEAAQRSGLSCEGCDGVACCTVDLVLHTYIEMLYVRRGFNSLDTSKQLEILGRCRALIKAREDDPRGDVYRNAVCVLNFEGHCALYGQRPMICRLAGIPHFIVRPDGSSLQSGGCRRFQEIASGNHEDARIDRSAFYRRMAEIEVEIVRALGKRTSPRTVADTLGSDDPEDLLP